MSLCACVCDKSGVASILLMATVNTLKGAVKKRRKKSNLTLISLAYFAEGKVVII